MKTNSWLVLFLGLLVSSLGAQEPVVKTKPLTDYLVWIELKDRMGLFKVQVTDLSDTTLSFRLLTQPGVDEVMRHYSDIDNIRVRKHGKVGRWSLIGAAAGAVIGGIVGSLQPTGDNNFESGFLFGDPTLENMMTGFGIGAAAGALVGALAGSARKAYPIRGEPARFRKFAGQYDVQQMN